MILDGEDRQFTVTHPFDGAVVQIEVRDLNLGWQAVGIDCKAVILGGDFHLLRRQVHDWLIAAAMAELEFVGLAPEG